jgi:hypothetical protein
MPHVMFEHVAWPAPVGGAHTVHEAPHALASSSATHALPQRW